MTAYRSLVRCNNMRAANVIVIYMAYGIISNIIMTDCAGKEDKNGAYMSGICATNSSMKEWHAESEHRSPEGGAITYVLNAALNATTCDPTNMQYSALYGICMLYMGRTNEAHSYLSYDQYRDGNSAHASLEYLYQGIVAERNAEWSSAIARYRRCHEICSHDTNKPVSRITAILLMESESGINMCEERMVYCLLQRCGQYVKSNKVDKALADIREVIGLLPSEANLYTYAGNLSHILGNECEAKMYYEKCLEIRPNQADVLVLLGRAMFRLGEPGRAVERYLQAVQLGHPEEMIYNDIGTAYLQLGDITNSIKYLLMAYQSSKDEGRIASKLGLAYAAQRNWSNAIGYSSVAIDSAPNDPVYRVNHAFILLQAGSYSGAIAQLKQWSVIVDPENGLRQIIGNTNYTPFMSHAEYRNILNTLNERKRKKDEKGGNIRE